MYIAEWVVVAWSGCTIIVLVSIVTGCVYCIGRESSGVLLGTVARDVSGLFAIEAESSPKVLASFFVAHRVDRGGDGVNVHGVRVVSWLGLIVSSLVGRS